MASFYEVCVLRTGSSCFSREGRVGINTCTLIKGKYNCIVNTMIPTSVEFVLKALEKHKLKPDDIHYVISTNGDYGNTGSNHLFLNSYHIVGHTIAKKDNYLPNELDFDKEYLIDGEDLKILPTPGRTLLDITVLVKIKEDYTVAITGGLIGRQEDLYNHLIWLVHRPECPALQRYHRGSLIKSVQRIIPEYGEEFDITDEIKTAYLKYRDEIPILSERDLYRIGIF